MCAPGCFDEGGNAHSQAAAKTTADGILAFPDIQANLTTDPAAAADALFRFLRTPIAGTDLIAPPFELSASMPAKPNASARIVPADVPDCLTTTGEPGCDGFSTNAECVAGNFTFTGIANRQCTPCDAVEGTCQYDWEMTLAYKDDNFDLSMITTGPLVVSAQDVHFDLHFDYDFRAGDTETVNKIRMCSCGAATVSHPVDGPRALVNSNFVVKDSGVGDMQRCALVKFDGQGDVTTETKCSCPDNVTCLAEAGTP